MNGRTPQKRQAKAIALSKAASADFTRVVLASGLLFTLLLAGLSLFGAGRLIGP